MQKDLLIKGEPTDTVCVIWCIMHKVQKSYLTVVMWRTHKGNNLHCNLTDILNSGATGLQLQESQTEFKSALK